jgi:hypothetical protein
LTPHTLTAPPTDRGYWRRLLAAVHPDRGGDHDLFVWTTALHELVAGDHLEDVRTTSERREPPPPYPPGGSHSERLDYAAAYKYGSFEDLTRHAVAMAASVGEPYGSLLRLLGSCYPAGVDDVAGYRAQSQGASYKQLAFVAHLAGLSASERVRWYRICEELPMAQRHAGHLIKVLQARGGGYAA